MITMKFLVVLIVLLTCARAFAAEPFGRASIEGAGGMVPGQQVHVVVDVFAPDFFTSPPQFPLFEVPDALVTLSDDRPQNLVQTIDGVQYSGIRRSYAVVPEKAGSFPLPEIDIDLGYSANGNPVKTQVKIALPSFKVAPASGQTSTPFAARNLTVTQSFDRDPASLRVGGAVVRTIVIFAEDTQAMLMPPLDLAQVAGLATYAKPPLLADGVERRGIGRSVETGSTRTETIVYTTSSEGRFSLPAISYSWFDVDGHANAAATLPAVGLVVAAPTTPRTRIDPKLDQESAPSRGMTRGLLTVMLLGAVDLAAALFAWRRYPAIRAGLKRFREQRRNSPHRRLRRLQTVIRVGRDDAIYRALQDWSRRLGFRTVTAWVDAQGNPRLAAQVALLERRLFRSRDAQLDRTALASAIALPAAEREDAKSALPDLNPTPRRPLLPSLLR
ncbi:BatD family protein [Rhizobium sullae]|uniref:Oxygen tolerance protein BatD n=1 Tax=Rhizobium sullae TaxID=50338 RepID=A0A4R3PU72_RHISU|nr:BatD family protein [Rhizobium sullae]TCU08393.1 oxygen tolerance protein BatD [Rhizobium sullae]